MQRDYKYYFFVFVLSYKCISMYLLYKLYLFQFNKRNFCIKNNKEPTFCRTTFQKIGKLLQEQE